ncbi:DNA alkylation repair protein [Microbacterium dauci]|uniref:DNA alkylation repair protein n=1 Tax=Microbacterium dauci TaxID=3048008 RepID=A0ABT6ZC97_9MICO|nr:DNA alkylation repair protein [Microbacterium sp. LX3-4]MDJ1113782.1 DNA alkylation repair protein [Microbacterium sp. LX3-4]
MSAASIRSGLRRIADPARAAGQQAYMKSALPFFGVRVPEVRRLVQQLDLSQDVDALLVLSRELWDGATHREERYAAMMLLAGRPVRGDARIVPLIEHMVLTGRWWDITDELSGRIRELHDADAASTRVLVLRWSTHDDLWLRRLAILSQLGRRDRTDRDLLAAVLEPNRGDGEFFIRKAIGWALRDLARADPEWVEAYVASHPLRPLSRREALKHL